MGKKSKLEESTRRDVVLMLLRREEPAWAGRQYNSPMRVISCQSGSNGNCTYVEAVGVLLFDAGLSGMHLAQHGRNVSSPQAPAPGAAR